MTDLDLLFSRARHADPAVRQRAAVDLGTADTDARIDELVQLMLDEPDAFVRETLIWAITARDRAAVPALVASLYEPDTERERVLHALSKIGDPSTIPAIIPDADHADVLVSQKAWFALGRIGTAAALPPLLRHLGEGSAERRAELTRALVQYGPDAVDGLVRVAREGRPAAAEHAGMVLVELADPHTYPVRERHLAERARQALVDLAEQNDD